MKHEEFMDHMRNVVTNWKNNSTNDSLIRNYDGFLLSLESFRYEAKTYDSAHKTKHELLIEFAKGSLRALLLVNTGGIFVIMTIVSALLSKGTDFAELIPEISHDAQFFVYGVTLAVGTVLLSYLTQWFHNDFESRCPGCVANVITILVGLASFYCFTKGAWDLLDTMSSEKLAMMIKKCQEVANKKGA